MQEGIFYPVEPNTVEAKKSLDEVLVTSHHTEEISRDSIKPMNKTKQESTRARSKLMNENFAVSSEDHVTNDFVIQKKKTSITKAVVNPPEASSSMPFEVSDVTDIETEIQISKPQVITEQAESGLELNDSAHQSIEVRGISKTHEMRKQEYKREKANVETLPQQQSTVSEIIEAGEVLKPYQKIPTQKDLATIITTVPEHPAVAIEEIEDSEIEDVHLVSKLPKENIKRKLSTQETFAHFISEPNQTIQPSSQMELDDIPDREQATTSLQSQEKYAQEQVLTNVHGSVDSTKKKVWFKLNAGRKISTLEPVECKVQQDLLSTSSINELAPEGITKSSVSIEPHSGTLCNKSDFAEIETLTPCDEEQFMNKLVVTAKRSNNASLTHSANNTEVQTLEYPDQMPEAKALSQGFPSHHEQVQARIEEETMEQIPAIEMKQIPNETMEYNTRQEPGHEAVVLDESTICGTTFETNTPLSAKAHRSSLELSSRMEHIVLDFGLAKDIQDCTFSTAIPSRETSLTRGDTKITSFDEAINLAAATDLKKTARKSRGHSRHGVKESVTKTESVDILKKNDVSSSRPIQRRDSSTPRTRK